MSTQNIMWTALPNGLNAAGDRLKISVLVSPRLITNSASGTLAEFPDFLDWPTTVSKLRFKVEFQSGPAFTVQPFTEPGFPGLDSAAWKALFGPNSPVQSFGFEDKSPFFVRSYPTRNVLAFVEEQYRAFAVAAADHKPTLSELGFDVEGKRGPGHIDQIAIGNQQVQDGLDRELNEILDKDRAVRPGQPNPLLDFYQVRVMHQFLSKQVLDAQGHRQLLPPQKPEPFDFHRAVAGMGQYQKLMRALGLAIDLEVPLNGVLPASNVRVTPNLPGPPPMTPWTAYRLDAGAKTFFPATGPQGDIGNGMVLPTGPDDYAVVEVDLDGAANKLLDFAFNLERIAFGDAQTSIDSPESYGLPSLRSAGFSAARSGRALRLVSTFDQAKFNNGKITADPQSNDFVLHADEVTRGYRIDVWTSLSGQWHSLCFRDGTYNFLNRPLVRKFSDEGFTTVATSQSADGSSTDLRLPESLFRWAGWSLCAPRPGKTIGPDDPDPNKRFKPQPVTNPANTDFKLETSFTVTKGTLPRLRFGALYQFRARAVDLAGNSIPNDAVLDDIYNLPPQPAPYLRFEPVIAPAVVLRKKLDPNTTPGESVNTVVVRSNFDKHIAAISERHIAPPKTSQNMAETHGMLDTPAGPPDPAVYDMLVAKDGSFNQDPAHPERPEPHPEAQVELPYLPDPFAPGAAFRTLPGTPAGSVWKVPFTGTWPSIRPFRLALDEGSAAPTFVENATDRVLTVHLPKAEVVQVALSCFLTDDDLPAPAHMLRTMKIWSWIVESAPSNFDQLRQLSLDGGHWMLTPPRTLTLVHAVQQPLIEPQFRDLTVQRNPGQTTAILTDEFPISGKSTIRVDFKADWEEPVDDLSPNPQPVILHGHSDAAFSTALQTTDTIVRVAGQNEFHDPKRRNVATVVGQHEFHDTKHRNVTYTAVATTRFREFFPDALTSNLDNITRKSVPVTASIPSSARPPAPNVLYVLPAFGWEAETEGSWNFSKRSGGCLRVYLGRPWFSSGEGELLGAVLWQCPPPQHPDFRAFEVPDLFRSYVTQWGADPIWDSGSLPSEATPLPEHFRNAVAFRDGLTLDELSNLPDPPAFGVAGHTVAYDDKRQLWFCDIELDPGDAYFPFVRLALTRFQPDSIPDAHLSRVILAEFIQLLPGRSASITFDPVDTTSLLLAVTGITFDAPGAAFMVATVQTQPLGGGGDKAWIPVHTVRMTPDATVGADTLWTAQITLPAPRGSRPFRILIEEFEIYPTGGEREEQLRLVYADKLNL
ncbi:MAG TPA: hypothetical protein VKB66_04710 [Candidatus Acidoferrum sp.]|nr:hypothetical protein [Candidatus Acidoferrum sp.]